MSISLYKKVQLFSCTFTSTPEGAMGCDDPELPVMLFPACIVELVNSCKEFKTLEEHATNYWKNLRFSEKLRYILVFIKYYFSFSEEFILRPGFVHTTLCAILKNMAVKGFLTTKKDYLAMVAQNIPAPQETRHLTTVGVLSRGRVELCQRCLESFMDNAATSKRSARYVIYDDSPEEEIQNAYRDMGSTLAHHKNVSVFYLGIPQRRRFIQEMAQEGIPTHVLKFALLGVGLGQTIGCNRNAFLLDTSGEMAFSSDDDMICHPARSPFFQPDLGIGTAGEVNIHKIFATRKEAVAMAYPVSASIPAAVDFLGINENFLGTSLAALTLQYGDRKFHTEELDIGLENFLIKDKARIKYTLGGLVGDGGSAAPHFYLHCKGKTREMLLSDLQSYQLAFTSRENLKAPAYLTLTRSGPCMTGYFGLDNRSITPPFFPHFRNEDRIWGELIALVAPLDCVAHLEWLLKHFPSENRLYNPHDQPETENLDFDDVIAYCYGHVRPCTEIIRNDTARNLRRLGSFMQEIGQLDLKDFLHLCIDYKRVLLGNKIALYQNELKKEKKSPLYWKKDMEALVATTKKSFTSPMQVGPWELGEMPQRAIKTQQLLQQFGELLEWWPTIVEKILERRKNKIFISEPL
jgi:hypothetical protein